MKTSTALKIAVNSASRKAEPVGTKHGRMFRRFVQRSVVKAVHGASIGATYIRGFVRG